MSWLNQGKHLIQWDCNQFIRWASTSKICPEKLSDLSVEGKTESMETFRTQWLKLWGSLIKTFLKKNLTTYQTLNIDSIIVNKTKPSEFFAAQYLDSNNDRTIIRLVD